MSRDVYDPLDPERMPTISALIKRHRDLTGDSYRQMSQRAEKAGYKIKHQTIAELANETPKGWPKSPETISALAIALRASERAVVLAFATAFGLDAGKDRELVQATLYPGDPGEWETLTAGQRRELMQILEEYVDERLSASTERSSVAARDEGGDGDADDTAGGSAPTSSVIDAGADVPNVRQMTTAQGQPAPARAYQQQANRADWFFHDAATDMDISIVVGQPQPGRAFDASLIREAVVNVLDSVDLDRLDDHGVSEAGEYVLSQAARGGASVGQARRRQQDAAGEESQAPPDEEVDPA